MDIDLQMSNPATHSRLTLQLIRLHSHQVICPQQPAGMLATRLAPKGVRGLGVED